MAQCLNRFLMGEGKVRMCTYTNQLRKVISLIYLVSHLPTGDFNTPPAPNKLDHVTVHSAVEKPEKGNLIRCCGHQMHPELRIAMYDHLQPSSCDTRQKLPRIQH